MKLVLEGFSAFDGHGGIGGLGLRNIEHLAVNTVHGQEGGGHARTGLEEIATVQALLGAIRIGQLLDARFNLPLLHALRWWIEFPIRNDLGWNRRVESVFRAFHE